MSLLQLEDDSRPHKPPSGEDLAKGSGHIRWTLIAAFVLVTVGIALFLLTSRKPPAAVGEVTRIYAHPVHTINTPIDENGVQTPGEVFDQVLVFGQIHLRNQGDQPIVLKEMMTNITLEDGIHSSYAASATDYDRIFVAYPELAGLRSKTLVDETVIPAGQAIDGMVVSSFHLSKEEWAARKNLNWTFEFKLRPDLVVVPKIEVTEQ